MEYTNIPASSDFTSVTGLTDAPANGEKIIGVALCGILIQSPISTQDVDKVNPAVYG